MDKMSLGDIFLVGVPDALVWFTFGILLCNRDYFKSKNIFSIILKFIISSVIILSIVVYMRTIVSNIVYTSMLSALLYTIIFKIIWRFNTRTSIFTGILFVFMSTSIENIFIHISIYTKIFSESRFSMSIPIRIFEIILVYVVYRCKINLSDIIIFKTDWNNMKLSNKITTIILIIFIFLGFIVSNSYTDILIKQSLYKMDLTNIVFDIHLMFYGVILLVFSGLIIINRTIGYENIKKEVRDIRDAFELPREILLLNFLRASQPEDIPKYQEIFTKYIIKEVKQNEEQ